MNRDFCMFNIPERASLTLSIRSPKFGKECGLAGSAAEAFATSRIAAPSLICVPGKDWMDEGSQVAA